MDSNKRIKKIDSLTGARFIAMLLIVFSHFEFLESYPVIGQIYRNFFHNPTLGVDYFFVVSGFGMMLGSFKRNPNGTEKINGLKSLFDFAKRHVKKIYLLYVILMLVTIPYEVINNVIYYGKTVVYEIKFSVIAFISSLTLLQSLSGIERICLELNSVSWFLSCLFCIYLVCPIILKFLKRKVKSVNQALLGCIICIIMSILLAFVFGSIEAKTFFNYLTYSSPYRRIFYVVLGMLLGQIYIFQSSAKVRLEKIIENGIFEVIILMITVFWFIIRGFINKNIGDFIYLFDMIVVSCDVYALAFRKGKISRLFEKRKILYLGEISMYIYLIHYVIRLYIDLFMRYFHLHSIHYALIEIITICLLTLIISIIIDKHNRRLNLIN